MEATYWGLKYKVNSPPKSMVNCFLLSVIAEPIKTPMPKAAEKKRRFHCEGCLSETKPESWCSL